MLGNISPEKFLQDYWQKKPCLIRQFIPEYKCPVSPKELAGLACEEEVSSRLVIEKDGAHPWQVKYGPFSAKDFKKLPDTHWTLLVQQVERYHQEIDSLLEYFSFIPTWRIDDVMVSYAATHGSVGPHMDNYDVFLLQGMGERRWQINPDAYNEQDFIAGLELRIIENFRHSREWTLQPGDMLYLPPGIAHHGIALEPCMTISIGFLAPSQSELIGHFVDATLAGTLHDKRYTDPDLTRQKYQGEITRKDLARIRKLMKSAFTDNASLDRWFGKFITTINLDIGNQNKKNCNLETFRKLFREHGVLFRSGDCRSIFFRHKDRIFLYINGEEFLLRATELPLANLITGSPCIHLNDLSVFSDQNHVMRLLCNFYQFGSYYFK